MLKQGILSLGVFFSGAYFHAVQADEKPVTRGTLEVVEAFKACFVEPCPQYDVLSIDGKPVENPLGATLLNFDSRKSAATHFKKFTIEGEWTGDNNYIEVKVLEWKVTIGEKIEDDKSKAGSSNRNGSKSPSTIRPSK